MKWIAGALTAVAAALGAVGCQTFPMGQAPASQPHIADLPPVPDRLRAFYQELQTGRFEVLADFEQPAQTQIFHVDGPGQAQLTVRRSRIPTGAGALEVTFQDAAACLVVDDQAAKNWALPRNWSHYPLLMASIYAPVPVTATLAVRSGTEQPTTWESAPIPLIQGWNLVRIDLSDVGRQVSLTDIRQLQMRVRASDWPLTVYLDDLMLADNTTMLFGDRKAEAGSLYVLKKGRRFHVGSAGRFELVFSRGLLTSWYDLSVDPQGNSDLAGGGPAGPVLVALDEDGRPTDGIGLESWHGLGKSVQAHLQIVETNPLAITLRGTVRFAATAANNVETDQADKAEAPGTSPAKTAIDSPATNTAEPSASEHVYTYTVRADGRVFVDVRATVADGSFRPGAIGLAVTTLNTVFQPQPVDPLDAEYLAEPTATSQPAELALPPAEPTRGPIPRALLLARGRTTGTSLLLAPGSVAMYERTASATRDAGDLAAHMYVMKTPRQNEIRLAAMVAVWPPDLKDLPTAVAVARDYQEPTAPRVEVGKLRTNIDGDLDGDGFAEGTGRWMVEPDGQVLRLRWPAGHLRFWPMLEVTGLAGKACWPYLDGRIVKPVARRPNGDAIFVVPEILSRATLLEVTVEK